MTRLYRPFGLGVLVGLTLCWAASAHAQELEPIDRAVSPLDEEEQLEVEEEWLRPRNEIVASELPWASAEEEGAEQEDSLYELSPIREMMIDELPLENSGDTDSRPISLPTGEERSAVTPQALSLPSGGGTIEGMGESFQALLSTGQATLSIPIDMPGGRGGFGPSISLSYSTGSGNSIAGIGWSVDVPFISRQTDRGLPRYDLSTLDRFIYNGGQELVPIADSSLHEMPAGESWPSFVASSAHEWTYFRTQLEGAFMRFFLRGDERQWIVQDIEGTLYVFGVSGPDTDDAVVDFTDAGSTYVYRWNLSSIIDIHGNRVEHRYIRDAGQSYLQHVYWNNPPGGALDDDVEAYQHHVVLEYEERPDPYFGYSSGFRIETRWRLWRTVVESVPFGQAPGSARSHTRTYTVAYDADSTLSLLTRFQAHGRGCYSDRSVACSVENNGSLPPMEFQYTGLTSGVLTDGFGYINNIIEDVSASPPNSVDEARSDFLDANADGIPDLLVTDPVRHGGGHGLYLGQLDSDRNVSFDSPRVIDEVRMSETGASSAISTDFSLSNTNINPLDIDGDGHTEYLHMPHLMDYQYFQLHQQETGVFYWEQVGPIETADSDIDFSRDAERIRLVDVNNDHLVDVVRTAGTQIQTFLNLGRCPGGDGRFGTPTFGRWGDCEDFTDEPITSCALHRGLPLDFSDSVLRLADMNGDGIQDIVHLRRGDVAFWPGRGPGVWGEGSRLCESGRWADDRELEMADSPFFGIEGDGLHLADVNADGTADLIQVRFDAVDIWLNIGGYGWTPRYTIMGTPVHPDFVNRVRLADLNGSGSRDIVWGDAGNYRFLDLTGGRSPRLLSIVNNGFGGTRSISYRSSIDYQVDAETEGHAWTTTAPLAINVISGTIISDGVGGAQETEYEYRDPVYDGLEAEFRGFSQTLVRSVGDATSPSSMTVTSFHQGLRPEDQCPECSDQELSLLPNPNQALKGAAYSVEIRSDPDPDGDPWVEEGTVFFQTERTTFTVDRLHEGRDGRSVWHRWPSQSNTFQYDNNPFEPGATPVTLPLYTHRDWLPGEDAPAAEEVTDDSFHLPTSAEHFIQIQTRRELDRLGRVSLESSEGIVGETGDEISRRVVWTHDSASWLHLQCESWVEPENPTTIDGEELRLDHNRQYFDGLSTPCEIGDRGQVTREEAHLFTRDISGAWSDHRWVTLESGVYDAQGQLVQSYRGGDAADYLRRGERRYDPDYEAYIVLERVWLNRPGEPTDRYVEIVGEWDSGLGQITSITDPSSETGYIAYDRLGRRLAEYRSGCEEPAVVWQYHPNGASGLSYVQVLQNEECDRVGEPSLPESGDDPATDMGTGIQEFYVFFDGQGRSRATVSEGDAFYGFGWVISGLVEINAKGEVTRSYHPVPLSVGADPVDEVTLAGVSTPSVSVDYDAFGRQVSGYNENDEQTFYREFGARTTSVAEANVLDGETDTLGSVTTTVVDGGGRILRRIVRGDDGLNHMVQASYDRQNNLVALQRGNGADSRISLGGAEFVSGETTTRNLAFNSLGQRTHTFDPDAGTYRYYYNHIGDLTRTVDSRGVHNCFVYDLAGRLVAEDYGCTDEVWTAPDSTGHSPDDDPSLNRIGVLFTELLDYAPDSDGDFVPENGADVIYGFDRPYVDEGRSYCLTGPTETQENVLGELSWIRNRSGCTFVSYDIRNRVVWTARQIDPDPKIFLSRTFYQELGGAPDELDRPHVGEYPDGSRVHYEYSNLGQISRVWGTDGASELFNRTFIRDITFDHYGRRTSDWRGDPGTGPLLAGTPEIRTTYWYNELRHLVNIYSELHEDGALSEILVDNDYSYDAAGNVIRVTDGRTEADWSPTPVSYTYRYDSLYRLSRASPNYISGTRSNSEGERIGEQRWQHDELGSMTSWSAVEDVAGEHFYRWSLGEIINGQQLIEAAAPGTTGRSSRCLTVDNAVERVPAPHALYFAYQQTTTPNQFEGLEACYDAMGNMVALYRLRLDGCPSADDPLIESSFDWDSGCSQTVLWEVSMSWDEMGRLERVEKAEGADEHEFRHIYDSGNERVIRLDWDRTAGVRQATLYVGAGYEIRNADVELDGTYSGGERTKFIFAGTERIARVVEDTDGGVLWPNPPGRPYVFQTVTNHLGSATATIDMQPEAGGSPIVRVQTHLPYGAEDSAVEGSSYGGWNPSYEFSGKEEDPEVGLMYFGARFYAPGLARWISPDPLYLHWLPEHDEKDIPQWGIASTSQLNLYNYATSRPINFIDPDGTSVDTFLEGLGDGLEGLNPLTLLRAIGSLPGVVRQNAQALGQVIELLALGNTSGALRMLQRVPIVQSLIQDLDNFTRRGPANYREMGGFVALARVMHRALTRGETPDDDEMAYISGKAIGEVLTNAITTLVTAGTVSLANAARGAISRGARRIRNRVGRRNGGCPLSFVPGTLIQTPAGLIAIEKLEEGDIVLSRDENTGELAWKRIVATMNRDNAEYGNLSLIDSNGEETVIRTTSEHPFWVEDRGWIEARELEPGDELFSPNNAWVRVSGGSWLHKQSTVYNFEVSDYHNYFASEARVWVHNRCPNPHGRRGSPAHRNRIRQIEERLREDHGFRTISGGDKLPEEAVTLPNGKRRFPDLVMESPDGRRVAIQVGRALKRNRNTPIWRERRPIKDLENSGDFDQVVFVPYDP